MKGKISISETGVVTVTTPVQMQDFEIAELFEVMIPTVRANIRAILKTNIVTADLTNGAMLVGNNIVPDYHGLDMIMALAFRIQSRQADIFRRWILSKATIKEKSVTPQIFVSVNNRINKVEFQIKTAQKVKHFFCLSSRTRLLSYF